MSDHRTPYRVRRFKARPFDFVDRRDAMGHMNSEPWRGHPALSCTITSVEHPTVGQPLSVVRIVVNEPSKSRLLPRCDFHALPLLGELLSEWRDGSGQVVPAPEGA